ncbi:MAG: rhomboid family intramembrane serine protease [Nitrososphaerota archaeon]|nr:rhomboid family intramembrane serine protease [Nitrososphaerota archaeon]
MSWCPACGAENPKDALYCESCGSSLKEATQDTTSGDYRRCSYCAKPFSGDDAYYFHCRYCEKDFCYEHRLPENHLCKSSPIRRNIPSTSAPYYATSGRGYYTSSSSSRGGFGLNISKQGRNLAILIVLGLVLGNVLQFVSFSGVPLTYYLIQINSLVYSGWYLPLITSMIVVFPGYLGLLDVFFNALAVVWVDRLLAYSFPARQYYAVFFITGLAGNLLSLLNGPNTASAGASGGLFGLLAGAVTVDYALTGRVNRSLLMWFVIIFLMSSFAGSVDVYAHLGGALVGLAAGYVLGVSRRRHMRGF